MIDMRILYTRNHNQMLNIALEHAILTNSADKNSISTIRVWRSEKSVVLGRNQNIGEEINIEYCKDNNISILRRISGGGAVYHDLGNLNISFFLSPQLKKCLGVLDIQEITKKLTELILKSLTKIDYDNLEIEGKSNIFYQGKKISGSAGYMYKNWYLHHATILEAVDINHLHGALLARESHPDDKKRSRYFETINLRDFNQDIWINNFKDLLTSEFPLNFIDGDLSEEEINLAYNYVTELYSSYNWIYQGKRKK